VGGGGVSSSYVSSSSSSSIECQLVDWQMVAEVASNSERVVCFSTAGHPLSLLLNNYQSRAWQCVSTARERLQIHQEPAEDSMWKMSCLHQYLHQSGKNSGFGVTEPHSAGSENITVQCDKEGEKWNENLASVTGVCSPSVSSSVVLSDNSQDMSSPQSFTAESHVARDMAAEIHILLNQLETDVRTAYDELQNTAVSEDANNMLALILQGFFFTHLWDDILTFYRYDINVFYDKKNV